MPTIMSAMRWIVELFFSFFKRLKDSKTTVSLPGHRHPVYAGEFTKDSPPYFIKFCIYCLENEDSEYAYYCEKCEWGWHKECMTSSIGMNEKVELPGHCRHPVYAGEFTKNSPPYFIKSCFLCHDNKDSAYAYYCEECDRGWHKECMPSSRVSGMEVKFPGHQHPLFHKRHFSIINERSCFECGSDITGMYTYSCQICDDEWHRVCIATTSDTSHTSHPNHAFELLIDGAPDYTDGKCHFCRRDVKNVAYHCAPCNFTIDLKCWKSPKPITINESKCHNHPLTLMAREVSFCCNVCGIHGERNPCTCLSCSFMVHEDCINRPHVINVNRHDHRISHTYSFGPGNMICKVCRQNIDMMYGAYSCSKCPDFVLHSRCATSHDVWDGVELKGAPNEVEEKPMFRVIKEGVINHEMHPSHNLRLTADGVVRDEGVRCQLCEGSVYSDKFYSCMTCDYILHETCAYLPKRKRNAVSRSLLSLETGLDGQFFKCHACDQYSTGYRYAHPDGSKRELDLRCAAVDWSYDHDCHPHTLYLTNMKKDTCGACNSTGYVLRCVDCKFNLCYKCTSYPTKIKHRCDDHPLVLSFGEKEQHETHWCTVCEAKADPRKWFYECEECGTVCHIHCALGDFANFKLGLFIGEDGNIYGVVSNKGDTRPHCRSCATRCLVPFIYRVSDDYFCSFTCLPNPDALEAKRQTEQIKAKLSLAQHVQRAALMYIDAHESEY